MPKWAKVLLAIGCGAGILLILAAIGGYYFISSHKDQWVAEAKKVDEEGRVFAAGKTANDCVDEALRRLQIHSGFMDEVRTRTFLRGCLEAAADSPGVCDGVPPHREIIRTATWSLRDCARRGMPQSQPCTRALQELQTYCEKKR